MSGIERVRTKLISLQEQLRPYANYVPGPVQNLATIVQLLEDPTKSNINSVLEMVDTLKSAFEGYRSMAPNQVDPILTLLDEVKQELAQM